MAGILGAFVLGSIITLTAVSAEEELIPSWIRNTAGFWADRLISDREFISALQFLIKEEILIIPQDVDSQPSSVIVTTPSPIIPKEPSSIVTTKPSSTKKYQPNLEAFEVQGGNIVTLVSVLTSYGKSVPVTGVLYMEIYDFDDEEIFSQKKYITPQIFEDYGNEIAGTSATGFKWMISGGHIKGPLVDAKSLYFNGLGTMKLIFEDIDTSYTNEILLDHLPFNEGFFNAKTGFLDNFEVNKVLDVGPFFVTVKDVGRYMGTESDSTASKEFFKVNLNTKFKFVEGVTFRLDEMYIIDNKNNFYSSDSSSIENLRSVFLSESYEYQGGNGYVLFEKIPSDVSDLKLTLKITRVEGDVSDTNYEDEIEISLR